MFDKKPGESQGLKAGRIFKAFGNLKNRDYTGHLNLRYYGFVVMKIRMDLEKHHSERRIV